MTDDVMQPSKLAYEKSVEIKVAEFVTNDDPDMSKSKESAGPGRPASIKEAVFYLIVIAVAIVRDHFGLPRRTLKESLEMAETIEKLVGCKTSKKLNPFTLRKATNRVLPLTPKEIKDHKDMEKREKKKKREHPKNAFSYSEIKAHHLDRVNAYALKNGIDLRSKMMKLIRFLVDISYNDYLDTLRKSQHQAQQASASTSTPHVTKGRKRKAEIQEIQEVPNAPQKRQSTRPRVPSFKLADSAEQLATATETPVTEHVTTQLRKPTRQTAARKVDVPKVPGPSTRSGLRSNKAAIAVVDQSKPFVFKLKAVKPKLNQDVQISEVLPTMDEVEQGQRVLTGFVKQEGDALPSPTDFGSLLPGCPGENILDQALDVLKLEFDDDQAENMEEDIKVEAIPELENIYVDWSVDFLEPALLTSDNKQLLLFSHDDLCVQKDENHWLMNIIL